MIKIVKYMAFDGTEFETEKDANDYEKRISKEYELTVKFKCELPCDNLTVGKLYPFMFKYLGISGQGVIMTINDKGVEIGLGETWTDGVIKKRFTIVRSGQ